MVWRGILEESFAYGRRPVFTICSCSRRRQDDAVVGSAHKNILEDAICVCLYFESKNALFLSLTAAVVIFRLLP